MVWDYCSGTSTLNCGSTTIIYPGFRQIVLFRAAIRILSLRALGKYTCIGSLFMRHGSVRFQNFMASDMVLDHYSGTLNYDSTIEFI